MKLSEVILNSDMEKEVLDKFGQLWFACYFERRLTKKKVENIDLAKVISELSAYFGKQSSIDFRRWLPAL
jgi:hypothetical protein